MRYITIVIVIIVYWFLLGMGLNFLLKDTLLVSAEMGSNYSMINISNVNMTTDELTDEVSLKSFPSALKIMFGFRTPEINGLPSILTFIISFINWFLVIMMGISIYRIINPLA